jgi:acetyltransferase (GNAT) family protein
VDIGSLLATGGSQTGRCPVTSNATCRRKFPSKIFCSEIRYLAVDIEHRRKGAGRTLVDAIKKRGYYAKVKRTNLASIQLLKGCGFVYDPILSSTPGWDAYVFEAIST